jgi:3-oxoacyl-[acyl-carrier-protein] synthase II
LTVTDDLIPPLINLDETDCSERIAYAPKQALQKKVEAVLSNSFGFGGTNASLLFSKVR